MRWMKTVQQHAPQPCRDGINPGLKVFHLTPLWKFPFPAKTQLEGELKSCGIAARKVDRKSKLNDFVETVKKY